MELDQETLGKLRPFLRALRALQRSVERALATGLIDGAGEMAAQSYQGLHQKISDLLPDDFYITNSLKLETKPDDSDQKTLGRVQIVATQLAIYIEGMLREVGSSAEGRGWSFHWTNEAPGAPPRPVKPPIPPVPPVPPVSPISEEMRNLGRDIQEQIINLTRSTLRRALSNLDVNITNRVIGEDMRGMDLTAHNFANTSLRSVNMTGANLANANLSDAVLNNCNLTGANLTNANLSGARIENTPLIDANFSGANCGGTVFVNVNFKNANFIGANMQGARFVNPTLEGIILPDGVELAHEDDLKRFGVTLVRRHIKIDIDLGDDDTPKRDDGANTGDFPSDPPKHV